MNEWYKIIMTQLLAKQIFCFFSIYICIHCCHSGIYVSQCTWLCNTPGCDGAGVMSNFDGHNGTKRTKSTHWDQDKMATVFQTTFSNANIWILFKISLKFVPNGQINNSPELVEILAWRRSGDKPLSEPMMVRLPTHICVTRPQWVLSQNELKTPRVSSQKLIVIIRALNLIIPSNLKDRLTNYWMNGYIY